MVAGVPASAAAAAAVGLDDPLLHVHQVKWEPTTGISDEVRTRVHNAHLDIPHLSGTGALNFLLATPRDFFLVFFPYSILFCIVAATNKTTDMKPATNVPELQVFLGLLLAMTQCCLSDRRMYWAASIDPHFPTPNFGISMPRHRFELILRCLRLSEFTEADRKVSEIEVPVCNLDVMFLISVTQPRVIARLTGTSYCYFVYCSPLFEKLIFSLRVQLRDE